MTSSLKVEGQAPKRRLELLRPLLRRLPRGAGTLYRLAGGYGSDESWAFAGERVTTAVSHGYKMRLRLDNSVERETFYLGRFYEWELQSALERFLRPGDVFIDAGANIGMITLAAAALVGPIGTILAFEPNPAARARLQDHVSMNNLSRARLFDCALGEAPGEATLTVDGVHTGTGTLRPQPGTIHSYKINVRRLDDFLQEIPNGRAIFLKIDTEGYDFSVLKGARQLLSRPNVVVFAEINDKWLRELGQSAEEMVAYMTGLGFKAFYPSLAGGILKRRLNLIPLELPGPHHWFNGVFVRAQSSSF